MNVQEVMAELERLGTPQNRKVYARHGVSGPSFGVSYGHLRPLAKQLGPEHDLGLALFRTGNHDARVLGCMLLEGGRITPQQAEELIDGCDNYIVTDAVVAAVARSPTARVVVGSWCRSPAEWRAAAGWGLVAYFASELDHYEDAWLAPRIPEIEAGIGAAPNRTRHSMNSALIAIGGYRSGLREAALAAAKRIGAVVVDHGQTGCKTPDAVDYIEKMATRAVDRPAAGRAKKKPGKKTPKKKTAKKAAKKKTAKKAAKKKTAKKAPKKKAAKKGPKKKTAKKAPKKKTAKKAPKKKTAKKAPKKKAAKKAPKKKTAKKR